MSESQLQLIIDSRERKSKSYFQNHPQSKIKKCVLTQNLDIGDIIFKYQDKTLLLIERKTVEDLGSSILDGRHKEQKYRIINSNIPKKCVIFLVEGEIQDLSFGKIKKNTLLGAIQNTMFRDGFGVYRTNNIEETCEFIERFLDKFLKDKTKNLTHLITEDGKEVKSKLDYIDVKKVKKKNNMTPEVFHKLVLLQIPGVSQNFVDRIFQEYNSLREILSSYESIDKLENLDDTKKLKQKKYMLADLELKISNGKKRKIGKVISQRIYEFLIY